MNSSITASVGFSLEEWPDAGAVYGNDGKLVAANQPWQKSFTLADTLDVMAGAHPTINAFWQACKAGTATQADEFLARGARRIWRSLHLPNDNLFVTCVELAEDRAFDAVNDARLLAETLLDVNSALAKALGEDDILAAVAEFVKRFNPSKSSLIYAAGGSNTGTSDLVDLEIVAQRVGETIAPVNVLPVTHWKASAFPIVALIQRQPTEVMFIEDIETDPRAEDGQARAFMARIGDRAGIIIPLQVTGLWQGVITFNFVEPQVFSPAMRGVFSEIRPIAAAVVASRRLYIESQQNIKQLRALDKLKDEFLANVSHELRTPLNAIIGLSDLMLSGYSKTVFDEQEQGDISRIYSAGQQLLGIVNDILDLSKIETGIFELSPDFEELSPIVEEVIRIASVPAKDQNLVLNNLVPSRNLPIVEVDSARIKQVLLNLVANAIKFSKQGTVTVDGRYDADKAQVVIWVHDEGVGIAPEFQEVIFERFRQVEGKLSRQKGGAGLGLPISRKLVELHGGQLWLESTLGSGSTFSFSLPVSDSSI